MRTKILVMSLSAIVIGAAAPHSARASARIKCEAKECSNSFQCDWDCTVCKTPILDAKSGAKQDFTKVCDA